MVIIRKREHKVISYNQYFKKKNLRKKNIYTHICVYIYERIIGISIMKLREVIQEITKNHFRYIKTKFIVIQE